MLRLVRAHHRGEYDQVPHDALLWIVAALNYLVDPFDLIPDKTPFLGFVDDATVDRVCGTDRTRQTLDDFMTWETARAIAPRIAGRSRRKSSRSYAWALAFRQDR